VIYYRSYLYVSQHRICWLRGSVVSGFDLVIGTLEISTEHKVILIQIIEKSLLLFK
jgi:hypothetical protein